MNTFIISTSKFFLFSILLTVASVLGAHFAINKIFEFRLDKKYKYIVFGDSHPECAFNDNQIPNCINLAISAESYFYTYQKVKEVLSHNDQVETVFVEFSNTQVDEFVDNWIWGYDKMNGFFYRHSPFMSKEDMQFLYHKSPSNFFRVLSTSTRMNLTRILTFEHSVNHRYGGYKAMGGSVAEIPKDLKVINDTTAKVSETNLEYLEKIVAFCKEKKVELFFIRCPVHYLLLKNEERLQKIKSERFQEVPFLDFHDFPIHKNEFVDLSHLNKVGSKKFSIWFNSLLQDGLLSREDKQGFIDERIRTARVQN